MQVATNGTATISGIAGGTAPYTILWSTSPAQGTTTATGLTAGTYNVTVTDANGCIYTSSTTITEPVDGVVATITGQTNIACNGGTVGDATVTGSGGTPYTSGDPYTYLWSDGQTTATAVGLAAGTYVVTVTDSPGCTQQLR
ncbi:MAG: SprB repeat-containing protein [Bacteroidetes bacterium]|nr:SprB repeat-containing protein [Bacteroidota bacterium]